MTTGVGLVESIFLIMRFNAGNLQYLQWFNLGCGDCGGGGTALCMDLSGGSELQYSCATSSDTCDQNITSFYSNSTANPPPPPGRWNVDLPAAVEVTTTVANVSTTSEQCSLTTYIGFSGTDKCATLRL